MFKFVLILMSLLSPVHSATVAPVAAVIGDSYTAGWADTNNPPTQVTPWYSYTIKDLGWQQGNVIANPGAGFIRKGWFGTFTDAVKAHPLPANTDYVIVQGGLNDSPENPALIPGAVRELLGVVHRQAPHAVIIVVGSFMPFTDHFSTPNQLPVARAIAGSVDTRYLSGFMCDFQTGPDKVHPSAAGHREIGNWVASHIERGLSNGDHLHMSPSGFYTV